MVAGGFDHGVDFAFSDEFVIDHSFTVPLALLRPEQDLPIVPVNTNVMAPPFPSARRFFQVGQAIRDLLEEQPGDQRIAVVSSGHLSIEIGGPKMRVTTMRSGRPDPEFDDTAMGHLGNGEIDDLIAFATPERMMAAGNVTSGFLNFVMLAGIARGAKADQADCIGQSPFLAWNC
jgi:protocatechuate 4,5-dioxygenase beta chain